MASETVYWGQRALAEISSIGTAMANVSGAVGQTSLLVTGNINSSNSVSTGNLIANNIIMSSNMSTNTGYGNVYLSGNLVVTGNIFSSGGSVGSGSGTSQGVLYSLGSGGYTLPSAFASGTAGPTMNGYHINLASFSPEAAQAVTQFGASTGLLKFTTAGLYQVTCVIVGDQPVAKVAIGKTASLTSWTALQASGQGATTGYDYVYNYPVGSSPSEVVTLPLTVTDITQYYYLDVFFSTAVAAPTVLYPTRSTTAAGSNFGTYVQVAPFGNYLTSATGVAAALLANCSASSNLSGVYSSNAYRIALTSANGWTVNGTSTSLAVTANGNFQVNQSGIYEVNLCLNTVGQTACQFQVGSVATDALVPNSTTPAYLYTYAPMYTQDPTTAIQLPFNVTNISNVYFVECSFPGTLTGNVALTPTSTFVSIKPIGGYINSGTNPWTQQGTSVYYNGGPVGIGGVVPTALTETLTVNGNTSFVGNVFVTSDASSNLYTNAKRVPAGSLSVANYVTGSVPLTTTTNLIQNYLSNAATITATGVGGYGPALNFPLNTTGSYLALPNNSAFVGSNIQSSNLFIEAWVYYNNVTASQTIANFSFAGSENSGIYIAGGSLQGFLYNSARGAVSAGGVAISAATWTHVAIFYRANGASSTITVYKNGTAGTASTGVTPYYNPSEAVNFMLGMDLLSPGYTQANNAYVYDCRVYSGGIVSLSGLSGVPATPTPFGTTQPGYVTGTPSLRMSLQSQYFPGASTSPYGPCLTLPGTVGSYYSAANSAYDTNWRTSGFCLEMWINYASFANATNGGTAQSSPLTWSHGPGGGTYDWGFGATNVGGVCLFLGGPSVANTAASVITTGSWNHIMVQGNGSNIYMSVNGTFQALNTTYSPAGGNNTIAPTQPSVLAITSLNPIYVGSAVTLTPPNFSVAKARLTFGTLAQPTLGNVYSSGNFTPSPNLGAVPAGATVAWSLESQFPLPTYPSIQDVTELPQQASSYGALPTPVGGVTSNVLGPFTAYPALDSIRFDGTGYIDYGNAATSVMTTNLWANAWTIEGWVYPTGTGYQFVAARSTSSYTTTDFGVYLSPGTSTTVFPAITNGPGSYYNVSSIACAINTWTHVAWTYDGVRSNVYVGGLVGNSMSMSTFSMGYNPSCNFQIGSWLPATQIFNGNLADVRVSNAAIYTGSSYTVPSAPLPVLPSTMLLLRSLGGQPATTLEVQGRGLNAVSLGATRSVQAYPPAPMSSYLLDTTSNASVTYGQGKYVASASSEYSVYAAWGSFSKAITAWVGGAGNYSGTGAYIGSFTTLDTLGNSYAGDWIQLQMPVSVILSTYQINPLGATIPNQVAGRWFVLGSRDGTNWTLVDQRTGYTAWATQTFSTFTVSQTSAFNYYRIVFNQLNGNGSLINAGSIVLNGTEESLCVTSDSKVGVGIANPQRTMEIAGDLVVSGTISGGAGMGSFRNRIINGDMRINQRGATSVTTGYLVDRWKLLTSTANVAMSVVSLVSSDTPFQMGFTNSIRTTVTYGSGVTLFPNYIYNYQIIEGYNIGDFNWGTPFGATTTVSFWHRTNIPTGSTACFSIRNGGVGGTYYNYNAPFTVAAAGVWQYVTLTVPPPPNAAGSWATGTNGSVEFYISSNYGPVTSVAGWQANGGVGMVTQFPWWQNAGNYIEFTGVQLEKGTVATPFEFRPYATELQLCQRYYETGTSSVVFTVSGASQTTSSSVFYKATKRSTTTPVLTGQAYYNSSGGGQAGTPSFYTTSTDSFNIQLNTNAATWGQLVWNVPSEL